MKLRGLKRTKTNIQSTGSRAALVQNRKLVPWHLVVNE
jgi:hypothetical protein